MAQQIFDKHWPLGKNGANELIPGAAILQTRDGKDEPITLAASFQIGESGLFLPTSKDNPLEVRVRQLEAELQQLRQLLQNGDAQVTLTGQFGNDVIRREHTTLVGSSGDPIIMIDYEGPIKITTLEWMCQHPKSRLRIRLRRKNGQFFNFLGFSANGSNAQEDITPEKIAEGLAPDLFEIHQYEKRFSETVNVYKFGLRKDLIAPYGLQIIAPPVPEFGTSQWRISVFFMGISG